MPISQSDKSRPILINNKPRIAITLGDVSGIGPEIIWKVFLNHSLFQDAIFVVIGDLDIFKNLRRHLKKDFEINLLRISRNYRFLKGAVNLIDMDNISSRDYKLGCPNRKTALASKQYIDEAIKLAKLGDVDCVVTGPIHKKSMNSINFGLPGHTEYIAHQCNVKDFAMMMVSGYFKVILVTTHIPLKEVAYAIKKETIFKKIKLAHTFLRSYFGIAKPKIALCALNPHSGEDGILGQEEKEILLPAVRYAQRANIDITGPLPSDSLFSKAFKGIYDAVVCLYHDQAMIPIKIFGLENTVNITLGLPFIRTSPAHGTAHDIADKFVADENSMHSAIKLAIEIYRNRLRGSF